MNQNPGCVVPTKENIYLARINNCHQAIDEISLKIDIIRSPVESISKDKVESRTQLERELEMLLQHLQELRDSIYD